MKKKNLCRIPGREGGGGEGERNISTEKEKPLQRPDPSPANAIFVSIIRGQNLNYNRRELSQTKMDENGDSTFEEQPDCRTGKRTIFQKPFVSAMAGLHSERGDSRMSFGECR